MVKRLGGVQAEEEMNVEQVTWAALREAKNRRRVLFARAVGLEELQLGSHRMECLKLSYEGVYGYLPKDKVDNYEFKGLHNFLGKTFEFIVDELITNPGEKVGIFIANRIEALKISANRFWNTAREGQIYEAFIRGIDPFHLYILVEGVEVKLNREEVDYAMYDDLREIYSIGDSIEVKILSLQKPVEGETEGVVEVSARILNEDPWLRIKNYREKSFYLGKLARIHPEFGFFVQLEPGLTVLTNFPAGARGVNFKKGDELEVKIGSIDHEKRRIRGIVVLPKNKIGASNPKFGTVGQRRGLRG
ncbi:hypothetical protein [Paenibacillus sp. Y412MC10]|uniref:hypothetical protein n=1 Tax=Geobacillus sp. (strain Y412MC10) TaxID=481743 RepID=UPI0011AB47C1|nr:hypothetical protein [Paenibacillus sp. Y412MC10]